VRVDQPGGDQASRGVVGLVRLPLLEHVLGRTRVDDLAVEPRHRAVRVALEREPLAERG